MKLVSNFIYITSEFDNKYFPNVKYYRDNKNLTAIHYAFECFNNGVLTYTKLIDKLAKNTKDTKENLHILVSKYVLDFEGFEYTPISKPSKSELRFKELEPKYLEAYEKSNGKKVENLSYIDGWVLVNSHKVRISIFEKMLIELEKRVDCDSENSIPKPTTKTYVSTEIADCYQPLFNLLFKRHNIVLSISEMDIIIKQSLEVHEEIIKIKY